MPELPEVEVMTRRLRRAAEGRVLSRVEIVDPRILRVSIDAPEGVGGPVREIERWGKLLCFQVDDASWMLHFRMTGQLVYGPGERHVRARLWIDGAPALAIEDPRCLAEIYLQRVDVLPELLSAMSPDPWPERRDAAWWAQALAGATGPLKTVLMDQGRIGGLGNIAASEICFRARLSPRARAGSLSQKELTRLADAAWTFLDKAVADADRDDLTYLNAGGPNPFLVYQRQGEPCPRCGAPIERLVQARRSTWRCATCQPDPPGAPG